MLRPTQETKNQALEWAKERKADSKRRGLRDARAYKRGTPEEELQKEANSILAEMAGAKALGIDYQFSLGQFSKPDLVKILPDGNELTISVKWSEGTPFLTVPDRHLNSADMHMYLTGNANAGYNMVGVVRADQVTGLGCHTDYGKPEKGMCWSVPVKKLKENDQSYLIY